MAQKQIVAEIAVVVLVATTLSACGGGSSTQATAPKCVPTYVYNHVKSEGSALDVVDLETEYNGSNSREQFTLSDSRSSTVAIEQSSSTVTQHYAEVGATGLVVTPFPFLPVGKVEGQAIYNSVHETDSSVRMTTSLTTGSQVQLAVPAGATAYGLFGVVMKVTTGKLRSSNCPSLSTDSSKTVILPEEYEWCTWIRGPDVFDAGGLSPCHVVAYDLSG